MTTLDNITTKIWNQCLNLYQDLAINDDEFKLKANSPNQQLPLSNSTTQKPDLIIFNNSFIFRDKIKTSKNPKCLAIRAFPPNSEENIVTVDFSMNRDWIFLPPNGDNYPTVEDINDSIIPQIKQLGEIVYILIGNVGQPVIVTGKIANPLYSELTFDSSIVDVQLVDKAIYVNPNFNDVILWDFIKHKSTLTDTELEKLRPKFFEAVGKLRKSLVSPLVLPNNSTDLENTFLDRIMFSLHQEIDNYLTSLNKWKMDSTDEVNYNNVLRISYNFADDIVKLLRLIISISDLKPILLWMTIYSQYVFKREFSKLELQKTNKPSISEYDSLIKGARNSRFHNLLNIKTTLEVNLDGISINAKKMVFFNEYSRRQTSNSFEFEDQQLVEVFTDFTRAGEKSVSDSFWEQNLALMKATYDLVSDICDSLKLLRLLESPG